LFPAVDAGAFDEAAGGLAGLGAGFPGFGGALAGAFVLDVGDGEPDEFDGGVVGREVTTILDDLADLEVERLDGYLEPSWLTGS
jgi:hypothetical protein